MKNIQKAKLVLQKNAYIAVALNLFIAILISSLSTGSASAAGVLGTRYIQMNDSGPSGAGVTTSVGNGLNVIYKLGFNVASTSTVGGIVIEFCTNSALMFDSTCTAPTGFNANSATLTVANQTNFGANAFAVYTTTPIVNRVILTRATAQLPSASASLELGNGTTTGITNPTSVGTIYARVYTYNTAAQATSHVIGTSNANVLDFGGLALSIAAVIQITARVQENLIFCVSAASPTSNCGGATAPIVTIGHGTTVKIIDSSAIDTGVVYTQLSTNAGTGAIVRIRNSNGTCGGLSTDGGTTCNIPPVNSGAATAPVAAMTAGTAAFGLTIAAGSGGTGTVAPSAPYANVTANYYGMDTTTSGSNVTTTYGSQAVASTGPVSNVNNTWTFAATAANTTAAGTYTANIDAIATGTF